METPEYHNGHYHPPGAPAFQLLHRTPIAPPPAPEPEQPLPPAPPERPPARFNWKEFGLCMLISTALAAATMFGEYELLTAWPNWVHTFGGWLDTFAGWLL